MVVFLKIKMKMHRRDAAAANAPTAKKKRKDKRSRSRRTFLTSYKQSVFPHICRYHRWRKNERMQYPTASFSFFSLHTSFASSRVAAH